MRELLQADPPPPLTLGLPARRSEPLGHRARPTEAPKGAPKRGNQGADDSSDQADPGLPAYDSIFLLIVHLNRDWADAGVLDLGLILIVPFAFPGLGVVAPTTRRMA